MNPETLCSHDPSSSKPDTPRRNQGSTECRPTNILERFIERENLQFLDAHRNHEPVRFARSPAFPPSRRAKAPLRRDGGRRFLPAKAGTTYQFMGRINLRPSQRTTTDLL